MKTNKAVPEIQESPEELIARIEKEKEDRLVKLIIEIIVGATMREYREEIKKRDQQEADNQDVQAS